MRRLTIGALACALTFGIALPAHADHAWEGYHWARSSNPFTLTLVDSVSGGWDTLLPEAAQDWNPSRVLDLTIEGGDSGLVTQLLCQGPAGKVRVCNFNYGPNLWFGLATVWLSDGHIARGAVQVNDFYFTGTYGNDVARLHVLCQEIGHTLGLDHHRQPSCMDDTNSTLNDPSYQGPNAHDFEQLEELYAHTDDSTTVGRAAPGPLDPVTTIIWDDDGETAITRVLWAA